MTISETNNKDDVVRRELFRRLILYARSPSDPLKRVGENFTINGISFIIPRIIFNKIKVSYITSVIEVNPVINKLLDYILAERTIMRDLGILDTNMFQLNYRKLLLYTRGFLNFVF